MTAVASLKPVMDPDTVSPLKIELVEYDEMIPRLVLESFSIDASPTTSIL